MRSKSVGGLLFGLLLEHSPEVHQQPIYAQLTQNTMDPLSSLQYHFLLPFLQSKLPLFLGLLPLVIDLSSFTLSLLLAFVRR